MPGWTDCCREIAERQSVVGVPRTETNRRAKLPSIGRAGGSGDGFGRAWSVAAVVPKRKRPEDSRTVLPLTDEMDFTSDYQNS